MVLQAESASPKIRFVRREQDQEVPAAEAAVRNTTPLRTKPYATQISTTTFTALLIFFFHHPLMSRPLGPLLLGALDVLELCV